MIESGITAKGQTTLPKIVREVLGIEAGDRIRYIIHDGEVRIRPVRPINRLFGIAQYNGPPVTLDDMEKAISEAVGIDD